MFYQGYILPLIVYGSVVWGTISSSNLGRISKLQKRVAGIILHADFNAPSADMIKELSWLPIVKRLKYNIQSHEQFDTPVYQGFTEASG